MTARTPEDLLAAVPFVLGFEPEDSLVLLTFGAQGSSFHARVDLPSTPDDVETVVDSLLNAVLRNDVRRSAVVVYAGEVAPARRAVGALVGALTGAGAEVVGAIRADGRRWYPVSPDGDESIEPLGVPYDVHHHPFRVQSVVEGRVTHASRAALADTLVGTDLDAIAAVGAAADVAAERWSDLQPTAEGRWVRGCVRSHLETGSAPGADDTGRLLVAMLRVELRDVAWAEMSRDNAAAHVLLWSALLRRCPHELMAAPGALLGFAAWLSGDGALAWCALDRALLADPGYRMAELLAQALEGALPPSSWEPIADADLPVLREAE